MGCVVEKGLYEGTEGADDFLCVRSEVLGEGGAVDVVVKETGAVGEGGGVVGEIVEEGCSGGVGGCCGLESECELGGDVVNEGEEGVYVGEDEVEGGRVGAIRADGCECVCAGLGHQGEGEDGCRRDERGVCDTLSLLLTPLLVRHKEGARIT